MNRDYPLAPTDFGGKVKRLEKREEKLVKKGNKAVDEGRERKAERLFGRAAKVEGKKIRLSERR